MTLTLRSPAFASQGELPARFAAEGGNQSPPLEWDGVPEGTRSLALLVHDPDAPDPAAPKRDFVHWVVYDLPAASGRLDEGASGTPLPGGASEGRNDKGDAGYTGPKPPVGRHRYFFRLHALDVTLGDRGPLDRRALDLAMDGHVLAAAELVGTYAAAEDRRGAEDAR